MPVGELHGKRLGVVYLLLKAVKIDIIVPAALHFNEFQLFRHSITPQNYFMLDLSLDILVSACADGNILDRAADSSFYRLNVFLSLDRQV